jgi:hypothetical protein
MAATDLLQKRSGSPAQPLSFRIFLASPGDVTDERELARRVIEQMRGERAFRGRLNLEPIAWDQPGAAVAMEAALTPQAAIQPKLSFNRSRSFLASGVSASTSRPA